MSSQYKTGIVWFRRDLRLADNPALRAAIAQCDLVVAVWIDDPRDEPWQDGAASQWWLHHSLTSLATALTDKGAGLTIRRGDSLAELRDIIKATGAEAVHWNRLYEPAAVSRDKTIKSALQDDGLVVQSHNGALLIEPWRVLTKTETPYRVFTPYWRTAQATMQVDDPLPEPRSITTVETPPASVAIDELGFLPELDWDESIASAWTPGESAAMQRAKQFTVKPVRDYDEQRNIPGTDGTSRLSPHLHFGEISARQVWQLTRENHDADDEGSRIFLSELGWREFSHYVLYHYPHTSDAPMNPRFANFPWRDEADEDIRAWQRGQTGIPIVDAGMRQLWQTGWMHNRVRMIVASFLVKNIRAHWLHGARWFWDTLVDADLPANSMGWQWSAGCGADAAPYFRIFNPVTQGERFDKKGEYVRHWVPELGKLPDKFLHQPWKLPKDKADEIGFRIGEDYPSPVVDLGESRKAALSAFQSLKESDS